MSSVSTVAAPVHAAKLSKIGNGEYSAASVSADPKDAAALGLSKQADGNYGSGSKTAAPVATNGSAALQSTPNVQAAIANLKKGGE